VSRGRVGLLADFENLQARVVDQQHGNGTWARARRNDHTARKQARQVLVDVRGLVRWAEGFGQLLVAEAFGDFTGMSGYAADCYAVGLTLKQHFAVGKKSSVDVALAVAAVEAQRAFRLDHVVVASCDADFAPLLPVLRARGARLLGIGVRGVTSERWVAACEAFAWHQDLSGERAA
jgi:hypothetical protein